MWSTLSERSPDGRCGTPSSIAGWNPGGRSLTKGPRRCRRRCGFGGPRSTEETLVEVLGSLTPSADHLICSDNAHPTERPGSARTRSPRDRPARHST